MKKEAKTQITPELIREQAHRIGTVRAKLCLHQPFYGVLLSMMDVIHETSLPTFATDGRKIYFNAAFCKDLTEAELRGVMLHEISHCIYLHCTRKRRMNRDPKRFNVACDYAINLEIRDMGEVLPSMALIDDKYRNMNAEQIYDAMPKDHENKVSTLDEHIELDESNWDDMEDRIITAYEATKDSKSRGNTPAELKRWIDKLKKNRVRWERIFQRYVGQALAHDDYSFARPNKRHAWNDVIMPGMRSTKIGSVVVIVDTSGSIGQDQLTQFASELAKIKHLVDEVMVITADCAVNEVVKLNNIGELLSGKVKFIGGGGSDMSVAYKLLKDKKITPELAICLTDGYVVYPTKDLVRFNNIWCITDESGLDSVPAGIGVKVLIPKKSEI